MRLLCLSHPCVESVNQDFFARIEARSDWAVTIVLPRRWKTDYGRLEAERWPGFSGRLVPLPVLGTGNIPLHVYAARLSRLIADAKPDVVYIHHEPYALATIQVFLAMRRSASGPPPFGFYSAQNVVRRYPWPVSSFEQTILQRASFAFPVSQTVESVLRTKGYRGPSEVLPLPVAKDLLDATDAPVAPHDELTLGYVGRLSTEKGVDVLLRALASLPGDRVRALIAGDGPEAEPLRRLAGDLGLNGRVRWLGHIRPARIADVYRSLDALVVPSRTVSGGRKEQFGRVVAEALLCRVPVIASDCGELPNLVRATNGGWIVPENDVGALADLVAMLADHPEQLLERATEGRRLAVDAFDPDRLADRFVRVVEDSMKAAGRA